MNELARIKQAMCDGEHTDGDLGWCVERIEELEALNEHYREESKAIFRLHDNAVKRRDAAEAKLAAVEELLESAPYENSVFTVAQIRKTIRSNGQQQALEQDK